MGWWTDWFVPLLIASGVLLIFNGGWVMILFLWILYLSNGTKQVEAVKTFGHSSKENEDQLNNHIAVGVIVVLVTGIFKLIAAFS